MGHDNLLHKILIRGRRLGLMLTVAAFIPTIAQAQLDPRSIRSNEEKRIAINSLAAAHASNTLVALALPFPFDKGSEAAEYSANIYLKFVPPVLEAPKDVIVRPNWGECQYRYTLNDHLSSSSTIFRADPNALVDYENIYGITSPTVPREWGMLDQGGTYPGTGGEIVYSDNNPEIFHYHTGAYLSLRRRVVENGSVVGNRYLFADTGDRDEYLRGNYNELSAEFFDVGHNIITWEAETKIDFVTDVALAPLWSALEAKLAIKAGSKGARPAVKGTRPWRRAALTALRKIPNALKKPMAKKVVNTALKYGVSGVSQEILDDDPTNDPTAYATGAKSVSLQSFAVLDEVPPTVRAIRQPEPFEANTPGGEIGFIHFDFLRSLIETSDNCDRPVELDIQPDGPLFWPVGQVSEIRWCGRDLGPNADGGRSEDCAIFNVEVVDTRPPILFTPPSRTVIGSAPQTLDIGTAGAFDVADIDALVTNDAPASFPVGRTLVTWTATDNSNNQSTGEQWVSVKSSNSAPIAEDAIVNDVVSFEPTRIDVFATDPDPALDGHFDQLSFRVKDRPDNGFFVAPLFPYFIEDHRTQRINPDGTYTSYLIEASEACRLRNEDLTDPQTIFEPFMVDVRDDGVTYVMDRRLRCDTSSNDPDERFTVDEFRIAKFVPDADGVLEFASEYSLLSRQPIEARRQLAFDGDNNIYFINAEGDRILVLDEDLNVLRNIQIGTLTRFSRGQIVRAFTQPNSGSELMAIAVSDQGILFATNGREIFSYDLERTVSEAGVAEQGENPDNLVRLAAYAFRPTFPEGFEGEPFVSWGSFTEQQGFVDIEVDSQGDLYASHGPSARIYKWQGQRLDESRGIESPPAFIGWMGACSDNLVPGVNACDVANERSIGFSCQDDLCGPGLVNLTTALRGSDPGQFYEVRGIDISPRDELYAVDGGINNRIQRFTPDGFFAGEAKSACGGSCFILGDFGIVTHISVNSDNLFVLDPDRQLTHVFETTPITDMDNQTLSQRQSAFVLYQSNNNYTGPDSFSFFASDGLEDSNLARVDLNVTRNFRAPVAKSGIEVFGNEDEPIELPFAGSDPDDDTLTFEVTTPPEHGTVENRSGAWVYTPDLNYFGDDSLEFVASDATTSTRPMTSAPERVSIRLLPRPDAPTVELDPIERVGQGYPMALTVRITDPDPDDTHRIVVEWGDGAVATPSLITDDPSDAPAYQLGPQAEITLAHTFADSRAYAIRACVTDVSGGTFTGCGSTLNRAEASVNVDVRPMVDLDVVGEASLNTIVDDDVSQSLASFAHASTPMQGVGLSEPVLDGDAFVYGFRITNRPPASGPVADATNVALTIEVPDEIEVTAYQTNDTAVTCSDSNNARSISCTRTTLEPDGSFDVFLNVRGAGTILEDGIFSVIANVAADEEDPSEVSGFAIATILLLNGDNDADGDGVINRNDAFPGDPSESVDSDADGIGNNADLDDDNDLLSDLWEQRFGLDALNRNDAMADTDGDGLSALDEFEKGTRPDTDDSDRDGIDDSADNCALAFNRNQYDGDLDQAGDVCDPDGFTAAVDVGDVDGDGNTDYALVRTESGTITAFIKDGQDDFSIGANTIDLGNTASVLPKKVIGVDEVAGVSTRAIALLYATPDAQSRVSVWDPSDGRLLHDTQYLDGIAGYSAVDLSAYDDAGTTALAVAAVNHEMGVSMVERRNAGDGSSAVTTSYDDLLAISLAEGNGAIAVLGAIPATGELVFRVRNGANASVGDERFVFGADWILGKIVPIADGFATLAQGTSGAAVITVWDDSTATPTHTFTAGGSGLSTLTLKTLQLPGAGEPEAAAVIASSIGGELRSFVFDLSDGWIISDSVLRSTTESPRGAAFALATATRAETGVLVNGADGGALLELRNASSGAEPRELTAESNGAPPPPPTPPTPPPSSGGGGGGGGSMGLMLPVLLLSLLARRRCRRALLSP